MKTAFCATATAAQPVLLEKQKGTNEVFTQLSSNAWQNYHFSSSFFFFTMRRIAYSNIKNKEFNFFSN